MERVISKLRAEIKGLSPWFKVVLAVAAIVYGSLWLWTTQQAEVQRAEGFASVLPVVPDDSHEYFLLTESLLNEREFNIYGKIETHRSPGYPLFVAAIKAFSGSYFAVTLAQILLAFASALVIRRIGIVFLKDRIGEIAGALFLLNPVTIALSLVILTDVLFLFLFVLGFYLVVTAEQRPYLRVGVASVLFAYAVYVRSMGIFVFPIFVAPILAARLSKGTKLRLTVAMLAILALSTVPWTIRNYMKVGVARFNSAEAVNLSWMVPQFLADIKGTPEIEEITAFHAATGIPEEDWANREFYDIRYSDRIDKVAKDIIMEQPLAYARFQAVTSIPFLFPSSILFMRDLHDTVTGQERPFKYGSIHALAAGNYGEFLKGIREVWWKFAERLLWFLAYLIAIPFVWKERRNGLLWVFVFITAYLMFMTGPAAGPRLSFQAWPYLFPVIVAGALHFARLVRGWRDSSSALSA